MKVKDILSKLDLSQQQKYYVNEDFLAEFDTNNYDVNIDKIKLSEIWLNVRYCTDRWVGVKVVLLDNTPVCISNQIGRKWNEEFYWLNKESYLKVKAIVEAAKIKHEKDLNYLDLEEEFGENYKLSFADDLIMSKHKIAFLNGQNVYVGKIPSKNYIEQNVKVTFEDGSSKIINIEKLDFPLLGVK